MRERNTSIGAHVPVPVVDRVRVACGVSKHQVQSHGDLRVCRARVCAIINTQHTVVLVLVLRRYKIMRTDHADTLVVFTHLPKAGGSMLGPLLRAHQGGSTLEACHLLWNGNDREYVCSALHSWVSRRNSNVQNNVLHHSANANLTPAVAFQRCATLWAQHVDFSVIELVRHHHPQLHVRPIMMVRHPADVRA